MKIAMVSLSVVLVLYLLFVEELYRYVFCRNSSHIFSALFDKHNGHEKAYYETRDRAAERMGTLQHQEFIMVNSRGQKLQGFYYPCGAGGKKIAFIVHGYRSNHLETAGLYYDYYSSRGIDVFCCDHTAIGNSEGHFIGFDVLEAPDCLQWIDFLKRQFGENIEIILHGFSMGAATVLQMSSHCPENVKFIISDSGYENARASMDHQIGPFYIPLRRINRVVAGYDWDDSDVKNSLSQADLPILFVHGRDDKLVPFENGPRLYEFYQGPKDCFFPEHTRHIESMYTSARQYCEKIDEFMKNYMEVIIQL